MTVGKSSVHALGNVWSGVKISTKMGAGDLRDTTSDVVSYKYVKQKSHVLTIMCRYGEDHGKITEQSFNMAADAAIGGFNTFQLVSLVTGTIPSPSLFPICLSLTRCLHLFRAKDVAKACN